MNWYLEVYDVRGAMIDHQQTDFAGTRAAVTARKKGETVRFISPIDAPKVEIDELVQMGAVRTFP
jgi:hypothetical protein